MRLNHATSIVLLLAACFAVATVQAQNQPAKSKRAKYTKLNSLRNSMANYRERGGPPAGFKNIPNKPWRPGEQINRDEGTVLNKLESTVQSEMANGPVVQGVSFQALGGVDNTTPADPTGDVGPNHIVVAVNTSITVFNKDGTVAAGGATVNAASLWAGTDCEDGSNGDPVVLYDESADRWVVALVHFQKNLLCIAASDSGDPLGGYHDHIFDFGNQLPDYAKLGINGDHLVVTAHMFGAFFSGTIFGTIDKAALYDGQSVDLLYWTGYPYGYLPVDVDGPSDKTNPLFVGFQNSSTIYVYEIQNINYTNLSGNVALVRTLGVPTVDRSICNATRGQCIDQPASWDLESLDGRLMHRAQLRDMGARESMVFSQTVNVGNERAGIAWYELRDTGSGWQNWQSGIYGPADGEYRWIPSIAMNAGGDIGMSFMRTSPTVFPSVSAVGQTASEGANASGLFDGSEITCANGSSSIDQQYKRSGDYAATVVDPVSGKFWAIQQYGYPGIWANWGIWVCEFDVGGTPPLPKAPVAEFNGSPTSGEAPFAVVFSDQSTNLPTAWAWDFGDSGSSTTQNPTHTYTAAGTYTVTLTASNAEGSDDEVKTGYISVSAAAAEVDHLASGSSVQEGSSTGSYTNTHANDASYQTISEGLVGNARNGRSRAQATWTFPVRSGKPASFHFNGWHAPSIDGDTWEFSYSTDNITFVTMFEVGETSNNSIYQSAVIGTTPSSQVWIRVDDTDDGRGNTSLDELVIDHMFVRTLGTTPPAPDPITDLSASPAGFDAINLGWTNGGDEIGTKVERKSGGGSFAEIASLAAGASGYGDSDLQSSTTYTYRVGPFNAGDPTWSNEATATTDDPPAGQAVHVAGIAGSGTDKKRWAATATVSVHNQLNQPESGVLVSGNWSNGESGSFSCTTNTSGECNVSIGTKSGSVDLTISNLQKSGFTYDDTKDVPNPPSITIVKGQPSSPVAKSSLELPDALTLRQNYPNPFNPVTILEYGLPESQHVTVSVYNALGIEVSQLFNGSQEAGWHRVAFDGTNLSSGLYVAVLRGSRLVQSKTMLLSK